MRTSDHPRHVGKMWLEPDRNRRTIPHSAFHSQSENQAPEHRDQKEIAGVALHPACSCAMNVQSCIFVLRFLWITRRNSFELRRLLREKNLSLRCGLVSRMGGRKRVRPRGSNQDNHSATQSAGGLSRVPKAWKEWIHARKVRIGVRTGVAPGKMADALFV